MKERCPASIVKVLGRKTVAVNLCRDIDHDVCVVEVDPESSIGGHFRHWTLESTAFGRLDAPYIVSYIHTPSSETAGRYSLVVNEDRKNSSWNLFVASSQTRRKT